MTILYIKIATFLPSAALVIFMFYELSNQFSNLLAPSNIDGRLLSSVTITDKATNQKLTIFIDLLYSS